MPILTGRLNDSGLIDPPWATMIGLGADGYSPGPDKLIEVEFRKLMGRAEQLGTCFVNPMFRVASAEPCREFFQDVRAAQYRWRLAWKASVCWSSSRWNQEYKSASPIIRQLFFSGVLIVQGRHIQPAQWKPIEEQFSPPRVKTGQVFGRLTTVTSLGNRKWQCRCRCGRTHTVREQHLLAGRTQSCGCIRSDRLLAKGRPRYSGARTAAFHRKEEQ